MKGLVNITPKDLIIALNGIMDIIMSVVAVVAITCLDIFQFRSWLRDKYLGLRRGLYLLVFLLAIELAGWWVFWYVPSLIKETPFDRLTVSALRYTIRWLELFVVIPPIVYLVTRKNSERRGLYSILGHLALFLAGWLTGEWFGIILISLPLLLLYYYLLYRFATTIVPAANPDNRQEMLQRFVLMIWYIWGLQFPIWVVRDPMGREVETAIAGDPFKKLGGPGLVWVRAHHAVVITIGVATNEVRGPGAVLTKPFERPFGVADLRTQLRTSEIEVVTKDGVPITAVLFTAFAIDREIWPLGVYHRLSRENPWLEGGNTFQNTEGSYPFSPGRVRAALSMAGVKSSRDEPKESPVHWDDVVLYRISETARQVLAERRLDEMWRPQHDEHGKSALDEIATSIRARIAPQLLPHGVRLFASRIVNYNLSEKVEDQKIIQQYIASWSAFWEQQASRTLAAGEAEGERLKEVARAFAHETLLTAVVEGLRNARLIHPDLPRFVVAARFVAAIEELLRRQPELAENMSDDTRSRIASWKQTRLSS
jgi:regulator of protease activity HflC (stomatin/prohibitin superfamily)